MSNFQSVYPSSGSVVSSARPTIQVTAYIDESDIPVRYSYTITKGAITHTDTVEFVTEFQGSAGPVTNSFNLPAGVELEDGVWSITASTERGIAGGGYAHMSGSPSALSTFNVASVGVTVLVSPVDNYVTTWIGTNHSLPVYWSFQSSSSADYQTAYQVVVRRTDTLAVVYDSGKIVSSASNATAVIPAAQKDVQLEWSVRTWNRNDVVNNYPAYRKVFVGTPPVTTVSDPTENEVINGALVDLTTSATTSGGRTVKKIEASLWQGSTRLWSRTTAGTWTSGTAVQVQDNSYVIPQSTQSYQYRVVHEDSIGLRSTQVVRNFTVTYTAPLAPTVSPSVTASAYDSSGYMILFWGSESLDNDFVSWIIERRHSPIDPNTGIYTGDFTDWTEVGRVYELAIEYMFRDYFVPANSYVEYRIKQGAIRFGQEVVSTTASAIIGTYAQTDSYWLTAGVTDISSLLDTITNLVTNPQTSGAISNNGASWTSTLVSNITGHPLGFVNGREVAPVGTMTSSIASVNNIDALGAYPTSRYIGTWIKSSRAGNATIYVNGNTVGTSVVFPLTANTWHWIQTSVKGTGNSIVVVNTTSGNAVSTDRVYFSGAVASVDPIPKYYDGSTKGAWWNGTANASTSSTQVYDLNALDAGVDINRLYNVTGDQFTTEIVKNEFNLIGRGRYVEKGDRLGVRGSLNAQIRDGHSLTARQKRLNLEQFNEENTKGSLRNPFGDCYTVSIGDIAITRIPGTGKSEFVDVTIPYTEVIS